MHRFIKNVTLSYNITFIFMPLIWGYSLEK